ncbi:hypothetical protein [Neptuniibacter sp. QD37_11]|uniref:hypothetical protein n=1 Tax=Neptuniibacter sp. QD37_11 TaxID=3398209 RepID=UPI0039F50B64
MKKLPNRKVSIEAWEKGVDPSEEVLLRIQDRDGNSTMHLGYYSYGIEAWKVEGHSNPLVIEWWSIPTLGTGEQTGMTVEDL